MALLPASLPEQRALFTLSYSPDTAATAAGLRQLLAAYVAARAAIVRRYDLPFTPDKRFEQAITRLVERE